MKKKIFILVMLLSVLSLFGSETIKPKTTKHTIKERPTATILLTEVYGNEFQTEYYLFYQEDKDAYKEEIAEKYIFEFISKYKVEKKFSRVDVEEVSAAAIKGKKIEVVKRAIFKQLRK